MNTEHTKVVFYLLSNDSQKARDLYLCRLVEKAFIETRKIYINADTIEETQTIDTQLWTFRDISFVPHALMDKNVQKTAPVIIGHNEPPSLNFDILINLSREIPPFHRNFKHIIEFIPNDEVYKKIGRNHYKCYQQQGYQIETHNIQN